MSNLEQARKAQGLTQIDMSQKLNIAVSTYNQYENGNRSVPLDIANCICDILQTNMSSIFLPKKFTVSKSADKICDGKNVLE